MRSFIVSVIVLSVLGFLERRTKKQGSRQSEKKFIMKAANSLFIIGVIVTVMMAVILIWMELVDELELILIPFMMIPTIPGLLLMAVPISGVWEIRVNEDEIEVVKCFILKKILNFQI